ncbi:MAG: hypothetical protein U0Y68_14160 [Blastocatellia bacterium]
MTVKVDVGTYDPLLGRSYVQISRYGLGFQRSQNGGSSLARTRLCYFFVVAGRKSGRQERNRGKHFEGLDTTILGMAKLAGSTDIKSRIECHQQQYQKPRSRKRANRG